jgi:hypothetical protein
MENKLFTITAEEDHSDRSKTILTVEYLVLAPNKRKARELVKRTSQWDPEIKKVRRVKTSRARVVTRVE